MSKPKILIVDDQIANKPQLVPALIEAGISHSDIEISASSTEARRLIERERFALMVLDLALPNRPDEEPVRSGGLTLLRDITARPNRYKVPNYVIGLTAFDDLKTELAEGFEEHLWPLLHYDPTSEVWVSRIIKQVSHILDSARATVETDGTVDVCIITALYSPELTNVLKLPWNWEDPYRLDDSNLIHRGNLAINGRVFSVISTSARKMGMIAAGLTALKLINKFRPKLLIMPGICAGVRGRNRLGDVILASTVWNWQSGKMGAEHGSMGLSLDPHQLHAPDLALSQFEHLSQQQHIWNAIYAGFGGVKPDHILQAHIGPVATGQVVLSSAEVMKSIEAQNRKLLGVEMECYGVYAATQWSDEPKPLTFAIKSVCDFGDQDKDDRYQDYAAYTSAMATAKLLEALLPDVT